MRGLVLSLFPGADLFGMAFEAEGFCVVRGPDILMGGDIHDFHAIAGKFDGVIGGPPCQLFSHANNGTNTSHRLNLIPEFERIVREAAPRWWLMENVPQAPLPAGASWSAILDAQQYGTNQRRARRFSSNLPLMVVPEAQPEDPWPPVLATEYKVGSAPGSSSQRRAGRKVGRRLTMREINEAMGLPPLFSTPALTVAMAYTVRGNGVPLPMGRALARAVIVELHRQLFPRA